MKKYSALVVFIFLAASLDGLAQQDAFILSGKILDATSRQPISIASLQNGRELILTNVKGEFQIKVKPGDLILISHTAYQPAVYTVETAIDSSLEILLEEKVVNLSEVEVRSHLSEERFKQEVLSAVPKYEYENKLAERNRQMIRQIVPLGYAPESNPYGLFKDAKSISEVSFFSTNPSMGLLKALKQIGQKRTFKPPPSPIRPSREPVYKFGVRNSESKILNNQE